MQVLENHDPIVKVWNLSKDSKNLLALAGRVCQRLSVIRSVTTDLPQASQPEQTAEQTTEV